MFALWLAATTSVLSADPGQWRWWKGNLHTHTLWSDGDDYPEMIVEWYKTNQYHFLALSDHNIFQAGEKWTAITNDRARAVLREYQGRFGERWVEERMLQSTQWVRLKTLAEFRDIFEQPDHFLLIPSEEISDRHRLLPLHINATNLREPLKPQGGTSVVDVLQRNVDAILAQRRQSGQPLFPHVNHPNFGYAMTAEELMQVRGEKFFEVYNGHPAVHNEGDEYHASVERMWDIMLAFRLTQLGLDPLYGLAVDDAHEYHVSRRTNSNPGRGWIMVRAQRLHPQWIIEAMEAGDFYASTGVRLRDVRWDGRKLELEIEPEAGVTYTTHFIGTRRGFDSSSQPGPRPPGSALAVTRLYSAEIGARLAEVSGLTPAYSAKGDEIYVRAKVNSSKPKANSSVENELEAAWVQPVVLRPR